MTNKRPTPLKDEPVAPLDELQDLLVKNIEATNALNKSVSGYTNTPPVSPETVATAARNAVKELLEERQRKFDQEEQEAKARGALSPQECYASMAADYADVLDKYKIVCDAYGHIVKLIDRLNETRDRYNARTCSVDTKLDTIIGRLDRQAAGTGKAAFPPLPGRFKALAPFLFKDLPSYCVRRACESRHVRWFVWICLFCVWLLTIATACFIAHDNAVMRKVIQNSRSIR